MNELNQTVWIVTSGFPEYIVYGVYSSEEKAYDAKILFNTEDYPEERIVDEEINCRKNRLPHEVELDYETGNIVSVSRVSCINFRVKGFFNYSFKKMFVHIKFALWARDLDHAIKIALEKRNSLRSELAHYTLGNDFQRMYQEHPELFQFEHPEESE